MEIADKELLERIAGTNMDAFNLFYARYKRLFYDLAYSRTNDREMTNDILQNFWMIIWKNPESVKTDSEGSARSYLYRYFSSRMSDYLGSADARLLSSQNEMEIEIEMVARQLSYTHVMEELAVNEIHRIIELAIDAMPALTQRIFICRWKNDYSETEVAALLEISKNTVHEQYKSALSFIRKRVATHYPQQSYVWIIGIYLLQQVK